MANAPATAIVAPTRASDVSEEFILDYCRQNNQLDWYDYICSQPSPKRVKKNGNPCQISFYEVRKEFVKKFFPELAPKEKIIDNFRTRAAAAAAAARAAATK